MAISEQTPQRSVYGKRKRRNRYRIGPRRNAFTYLKSNTWLLTLILGSIVTALVLAVGRNLPNPQ
jgi:hypothetical protein